MSVHCEITGAKGDGPTAGILTGRPPLSHP